MRAGPSSTGSSRFADVSATAEAEDDAWDDMDSLTFEGAQLHLQAGCLDVSVMPSALH